MVGYFFAFFCLPFFTLFFPADRRWSTFEVMDGIVFAVAVLGNRRDGEVKYDKRTSAILLYDHGVVRIGKVIEIRIFLNLVGDYSLSEIQLFISFVIMFFFY